MAGLSDHWYLPRMNTHETAGSVLLRSPNGCGIDVPSPRPQAILFVHDNTVACVCAWCEDKGEADAWCRARGFDTTHTICPACRARSLGEYELDRRKWVA